MLNAAPHIFADYRQRRAKKTLRTPRTSCWPRPQCGAWTPTNSNKQESGSVAALDEAQRDRRAASVKRTLPIILLYIAPFTASPFLLLGEASPGG